MSNHPWLKAESERGHYVSTVLLLSRGYYKVNHLKQYEFIIVHLREKNILKSRSCQTHMPSVGSEGEPVSWCSCSWLAGSSSVSRSHPQHPPGSVSIITHFSDSLSPFLYKDFCDFTEYTSVVHKDLSVSDSELSYLTLSQVRGIVTWPSLRSMSVLTKAYILKSLGKCVLVLKYISLALEII